jgi:hypothetical protein
MAPNLDLNPINTDLNTFIETDEGYLNFINSCKSEMSKLNYKYVLEGYLLFYKITTYQIVSLSIKDAEKMIIKYIEYMIAKT